MSIYSTVKKIKIARSKFNLSFQNLLTMNMGTLTPIFCKEVLPGDKFTISADAFIRFKPMLAPVMSDLKVAIHFWYCPNRILYKDWNDFITEANKEAVLPYFTCPDGIDRGSLLDYLGYPANTLKFNSGSFIEFKNINPSIQLSALPVRAYNLIYNEFYRDEDLQEEIPISFEGGEDLTTSKELLYRAWKKDYFTSARAQAQFGDGVTIPLGDSAPVIGDGKALGLKSSAGLTERGLLIASDRVLYGSGVSGEQAGAHISGSTPTDWINNTYVGVSENPATSGLKADLSTASAIDVIKLRLAGKMQQFLERKNITGNRINEFIQSFYGVKPSDARLQLPEFLGGSVSDCVISEIVQTSESSANSPQGNMSGHGVAFNGGNIQVKSRHFTEHGFIIGIMNLQPSPSYCQGVSRQLTRKTAFDFAIPIFQNIGEQEILNQEIFGNSEEPEGVFGHAPRYAEYKSYNNEFHGDFLGNKDYWHTGRIFENEPRLNSDFIECKPSERIFDNSDENDNKLMCRVNFKCVATRPFTYYSEPGIVKF